MQLKRRLNLFDATLLVIGNVVGAGIFTTSGFLAGELPQPLLFIAIWVIGGLLTICGALTYAEMAGRFPRSGGDYQFLKEAYGPGAGFLLGWVSFWVITPGSIAGAIYCIDKLRKRLLPPQPSPFRKVFSGSDYLFPLFYQLPRCTFEWNGARHLYPGKPTDRSCSRLRRIGIWKW